MKREQKKLEIKKWVTGATLTAVLPFLAATFSWAADDFTSDYFDYFPYIDALLLLYAVALNCFILTNELEGIHKDRVLEIIIRIFSSVFAILSALFYIFLMGKEKNEYAKCILLVILVVTVLNLLLGVIYIMCDYKNEVDTNDMSANSCNKE